jgi:signal peptidase I
VATPDTRPAPRAVQPAPAAVKANAKQAEKGEKNEALEWFKSIAIAVLLFLFIRTFLVQAYSIPSPSMEGTLMVGDYLMANNAVFGAHIPFTDVRLPALRDPKHGEIVVFRPTYNDPIIDVVKRVIGTPGDTLRMEGTTVYRNGQALSEPYAHYLDAPDEPVEVQNPDAPRWHREALAPGVDAAAYRPTRNHWGPIVVPQGHYFLMGDNRDQSLDSRFMGFIPRDVIRGKPMFVYFSYNPQQEAPFPKFLTAARWGRIGTAIRSCCNP